MKSIHSFIIKFFLVGLMMVVTLNGFSGFKEQQLQYERVRKAYQNKEGKLKKLLEPLQIELNEIQLFIRVFKEDGELEIWAKKHSEESFLQVMTITICRPSGEPGPKRRKYDLQVPEGFYHINRFHPTSDYHLSLFINYPNKSDRILGEKGNLGGSIAIHGNCVTIGCIPIRDEFIEYLYVLAVEAKSNNQLKIPVFIYPTRMSPENFERIKLKYAHDTDRIHLWEDLKSSYDQFNKQHVLPQIDFLENGRHLISE
jgi:murein L,D-transpeptidase YafK